MQQPVLNATSYDPVLRWCGSPDPARVPDRKVFLVSERAVRSDVPLKPGSRWSPGDLAIGHSGGVGRPAPNRKADCQSVLREDALTGLLAAVKTTTRDSPCRHGS